MKYLMKLESFTKSETYIKTYEDNVESRYDSTPKLTLEERKLMMKVRYTMNKFWGGNFCGVSKNRDEDFKNYRFLIYSPGFIIHEKIKDWELKKKYWLKFMNEIGAVKEYDFDDSSFLLNNEQMQEIILRTKYIDILIDTEKYNL